MNILLINLEMIIMNTLRTLTNEALIESYKEATQLALHPDFIHLLEGEIKRRRLPNVLLSSKDFKP